MTSDVRDLVDRLRRLAAHAQYRALADSVKSPVLLQKDEHPFQWCLDHVIPAMADEGKEPDDPEAFCGWWKAQQEDK